MFHHESFCARNCIQVMILLNREALALFFGNLLLFFAVLILLNRYVFDALIHRFQNKALPWIMSHYENLLQAARH